MTQILLRLGGERKTSSPKFNLIIAPLLLAGLVAGCSASENPANLDLPEKNISLWSLPLDQFIPSNNHIRDYAEALVIVDCMAEAGQPWPVPWQDINESPNPTRTAAGRRIFNIDIATKWGYHTAPWSSPSAEAWRAFGAVIDQVQGDPQWEAAHTQCFDAGRKIIPAMTEDANIIGSVLASNALDEAFLDEDVVSAADRWRECMLPLGITELPDTPEGMPTDTMAEEYQVGIPRTTAGAEEIEIAIADAKCMDSSGYNEALYSAEWNIQVRLIQEQADALNSARAEILRINAAVEKVIAEHAPPAP